MFNSEFYPTPLGVMEQMGIDCYDKVVLEPSAGKGDIIDYLWANGASEVLACELHEDLAKLAAAKAQLIGTDFFTITSEQVSHVNLMVMNPPFSNADKHILHAWKIAPEGCEIISLCNWETIENSRTTARMEVESLVGDYGECQNLGTCFTIAERKTNVEVGLIRLFKPVLSADYDWDGFFYENDNEGNGEGIMTYNEVRAIVNTYVAAVSCFDRAKAIGDELSSLTGETSFEISVGQSKNITSKKQFARKFQIRQWKRVFAKLNIEKYVTRGVMEDINKFISSRLNYPFTMKNIYRMIDIVIGTREATMNKAIIEAVDNFTKHTHENRYGLEGWKTNEGHLLNKKFICSWIARLGIRGDLQLDTSSRNTGEILDLMKALSYLTGTDFEQIENPYRINDRNIQPNTWYDWGFFEFKLFKKRTGHFRFKDDKVWELLNRTYAKIKGNTLFEGSQTSCF